MAGSSEHPRADAYADTHAGADVDGTARAMHACAPVADVIALAQLGARLEGKLFGSSEPVRLGRYIVQETLGRGGMGVVYRAQDPELQRDVALKVLHPGQLGDDRSRARMQEEARTLASLDHPSIVEIHDVVFTEGQLVLVMPLLNGVTLAAWTRSAPRSWREIVAVYAHAGDGLAAAHSVGVVHRDFKPGNAMLLGDGRVRVLDFGLARRAGSEPGPPPAVGSHDAASDEASRLTASGAVAGTPGYWSSEQLSGGLATPASDQFAFCVALHTALEGVLPFRADSIEAQLADIRAGRIIRARQTHSVPAWLRALVTRGLADDPAARFPTMRALLAELRRPRGWRRWRATVLVGGTAAIAVASAFTVANAANALPPCDGGTAAIAPAWGVLQRTRLAATMAVVPSPALHAVADGILAGLDAYRNRWQSIHLRGCVAHRAGSESSDRFDRRTRCLAQRREALAATVSALVRVDSATAGEALAAVTKLPNLDGCDDIESLDALTEPPAPLMRTPVAALRMRLEQARASDNAGRSSEAKAFLATVGADADRTGYQPVIAEARLLQGKVLLERGEDAEAIAVLAHAQEVAFAAKLPAVAIEAAARRLFLEARQDEESDEHDVRLARIFGQGELLEQQSRDLPGDCFARPLLLNNLAGAYSAAEQRGDALRLLETAHAELAALATVSEPDIELSAIDLNLARFVTDPARRMKLLAEVWNRRRTRLGDRHLQTLEALDALARFDPDLATASVRMNDLAAIYEADYPELIYARAEIANYRGFLAEVMRKPEQAEGAYRDLADLSAMAGPIDPFWGDLATGHLARLAGDRAAAVRAYQRVSRAFLHSSEWWERNRAAEAEWGLALTARAAGDTGASHVHAATATLIYDHAISQNEKLEPRLREQALAQ